MMKSNLMHFMLMNYPLLINSIIIIIMMMPHKNNKYHPMMLMIMLILLTIMISLKMNIMYKSWMNFILFLIMIGGLMVIYMYITSLINNKNLNISLKNIIITLFKFTFMMLLLYMMLYMSNNSLYLNSQEMMTSNYNIFEKKNELLMSEIYHYNKYSMMFIIMYLFYSMMCIMNICYKIKMPLRQLYLYE